MQTQTKNTLQEIGLQLDRNQFPRVYNGGIVKPGDTAIVSLTPGKVNNHVKQRQRRPETRSWQGATRRQRTSNRSWTPSRTSSFICSSLRNNYEAELDAVQEAYPATKIWHQEEGMWLLTESLVLPELGKKATFLCAIPYSPTLFVRSWGFWTTSISIEWIGPRHTNFPDGSICAFEPEDKTWKGGNSIVKLLDLYSLWALRQEHLRKIGRWPGRQSVHHPHERVTELRDNEYCGCALSDRLYGDCCKRSDLSRNQIEDAVEFWIHFARQQHRKPPHAITNFISDRDTPPPIKNLLL
jgi:hypothetical protein